MDLSDLLAPEATPAPSKKVGPLAPLCELPATIRTAELCDLLGLTSQRLGELAKNGVVKRGAERGTYLLRESLRSYAAHLREQAGRAGRPFTGGDDLKVERTRLAKEQADAQELKNAALRAELVPAEAVTREWAAILTDVRAGMLAIPPRIPELTPALRAKLDVEIRLALERLANG